MKSAALQGHIAGGSLVSVLIPAFNYGRYLGQTLKSLQAQSYGNWECIVVDDGSTDDTPEVVAEFASGDSRIRYLRQPNQGQPAARNLALRTARGQYIQLLDADDLIEPDKLRRQVQFLEERRDVDIVYGNVRYFRTDHPHERRFSLDGPDAPWMPCTSGAGIEMILRLICQNIMVINAPLTRRTVFDDVGPFDERLARADDWDMWVRCALAGKRIEYHDAPGTMALVRCHPTSLTRRDRRLTASSLAIGRKVAAATTDPQVRALSEGKVEWLEQVCGIAERIDRTIPADCAFVLVDGDQLRPELLGYRAIPFTERDGQYWGPPQNCEAAIVELERLRSTAAAQFIVVTREALWHLEDYPAFRAHLESSYRCVTRGTDLVIYDLRRSAPAKPETASA